MDISELNLDGLSEEEKMHKLLEYNMKLKKRIDALEQQCGLSESSRGSGEKALFG